MSYERLNLKNEDILDETHLEHLENGIEVANGVAYTHYIVISENVETVEYDFVDNKGNEVLLRECVVAQNFISTNVSGADTKFKLKLLDGSYTYSGGANNYANAAGNRITGVMRAELCNGLLIGFANKNINGSSYNSNTFACNGMLYPVSNWGDKWSIDCNQTNPVVGIAGFCVPGAVSANSEFYISGVKT